jgi:hypothetical protein
VSLHDPIFVVCLAELEERQPQFFYGFKVPHPEQIFFQGSDKPFSTAITFCHSNRQRRLSQGFSASLRAIWDGVYSGPDYMP